MCQYAVVFSSKTGNTEKIATAIYNTIPSTSKDIVFVNEGIDDNIAENYFIGFNANSGSCTEDISYFLNKIHNKKVALFGTYGGIDLNDIYNSIIKNTLHYLPRDNKFLGSFLCTAKLPISERQTYESLCKSNPNNCEYSKNLKFFDSLMLHPDINDENNAKTFALDIVNLISDLS